MVAEGAVRAAAMLRRVLDDRTVDRILDSVSSRDPNDGITFWAAGGTGPKGNQFLTSCVRGPREDTAGVAA
jgi:hypothetical protein